MKYLKEFEPKISKKRATLSKDEKQLIRYIKKNGAKTDWVELEPHQVKLAQQLAKKGRIRIEREYENNKMYATCNFFCPTWTPESLIKRNMVCVDYRPKQKIIRFIDGRKNFY